MTKAEFPIVRNVSENGHSFTRTINENDKVQCVICGSPILIDYRTVHVADDGMQMVDCPLCKSHVSVLYYFDQVNQGMRGPIKVRVRKGQKIKVEGI